MQKLRLILMTIVVVLSSATGLIAQEKYAVIITGDSPGDSYQGQYAVPNSDYDEFWNDTYLMWEMLVTKFGFDHEKVFVLYATGLDENQINPYIATRYSVANSGTLLPKITDYAATIENVNNVLTGMTNGSNDIPLVMEDDFLIVFTFGHGIDDSVNGVVHGYLKLNDGYMIDTQFGDLINGIHSKRKVIWMENCCGGDFQDEFTNDYCYFLSASGSYGAAGAYPADDIFKIDNN